MSAGLAVIGLFPWFVYSHLIKMSLKNNHLGLSKNIWLTAFILCVLAVAFSIYVAAEKRIDRANEQRQLSYLLTDQLRQSSDDLSRMVRAYVITGDPRYKKYYQYILDIRNGKMPRPEEYFYAYWDMVVANKLPDPSKDGQGIALLDLMRQAGFTEEELGKLTQAKENSDYLAALELDAMRLVELGGSDAEDNKSKARQMLYDANYLLAKANIMQPINDVFRLADKRTLTAVHEAEFSAIRFKWIFIASALGVVLLLWRSYKALNETLGSSLTEIQAHMRRIADGDLTTAITIRPALKNSVLAGLSQMQATLRVHDIEQKRYEAIVQSSHDAIISGTMEGIVTSWNAGAQAMFGYSSGEMVGQSLLKIIPAELISEEKVILETAARGERISHFESIRLCKDGNLIDISSTMSPIIDNDGNIIGVSNIIRDISKHKQATLASRRYKMVIDVARDGFWEVDLDGNILDVNQAYADMSGYSINELLNMHIEQLEAAQDAAEIQAHIAKILAQGHDLFETHHRKKDGQQFEVEVSVNYMAESQLIYAFFRDISERKTAQAKITRLLSRQRAILDGANYSIIATDCNGLITDFNNAAERMLGYPADEIIGKQTPEIIHDREEVLIQAEKLSLELGHPVKPGFEVFVAKSKQGCVEEHEWTYIRKDGTRFPVLLSVTAMFDEHHAIVGFIAIAIDTTERRKAEYDLRIAAATFETHEAIMITDANANILRVNHAFETITGFTANEVVGHNPRILSSGRHDQTFYHSMWQCLLTTGMWEGEMWDRRKSGQIYPKWLTITALKDTQSKPTEYVAIFTDITERKRAEEDIRNLAFYDPLTSLPNRRLLLDRLKLTLTASERSKQYGALLFLDMDKFKSLNDLLGHEVGDQMLIEVADRIKFNVREADTVARFGGDEFVVLFEDLGEELEDASQKVALIGEKIRSTLALPYHFKHHIHNSSPSIGICMYRGNTVPGGDLIKHADIAMYQAKNAGRNRVQFFDPVLQKTVETRITLESDLRLAISAQQFQLYYQVQCDNNNKAFGAETLIRWIHPERGMISPAEFIPVAEESDLILDIGLWVINTACRQLATWSNNDATQHLLLAINVSAHQFMMSNFVDTIQAAIKTYDIDPSRLKLELTESVILNDVEEIVQKMQVLKELGIRLSLDDFGTGYSSLSYLKKLPINQIKIDQSFVRDIASDPNDAVMVKNIIDIAKNFHLNVIAEGVETQEQFEFLQRNGCMAYQGYLFGKPLPLEKFECLLNTKFSETSLAIPEK